MPNSTIAIKSPERFRQLLDSLNGVHGQIDAKLTEGQKLTEALHAAASKGVVASDGTSAGPGAGSVAPAYAQTLTAAGEAANGVATHVTAVKSSLGNVLADLHALLTQLTAVDSKAAGEIKKA